MSFVLSRGGKKEISYSLCLSIKDVQHSHREYFSCCRDYLIGTKKNITSTVKRPGDLPEPDDNPHPYTDFEELEIESYIATDQKTREIHMDIENQIAEVVA